MATTDMALLTRTVGRAIARHRQRAGLTQEQVAERLGIGNEAVSRIERGVVMPTVARLVELAGIFGCDVADLLTETSHRSDDQAQYLSRLLAGLAATDPKLVPYGAMTATFYTGLGCLLTPSALYLSLTPFF